MSILKKYSMNYEGGKCPLGYEFVNSYTQNGRFIDSYCRKIPKHRWDPESRQRKIRALKENQSQREAEKAYYEARREQHLEEVNL